MAQYKAIKYFTDLQDNYYAYREGDTFPRDGLTVSEERIKELSTSANRRGCPMIQIVEDIPKRSTETPKEEPLDVEAGESPIKQPKAKKSTKKG